MPDVEYPKFAEGLLQINNKRDFQQMVVAPFLGMLAQKTTSGLSISGIENIDTSECYSTKTMNATVLSS